MKNNILIASWRTAILFFVLIIPLSWKSYSQNLSKFVSITSSRMIDGKRVSPEYISDIKYFGNCESTLESKYLYLWVPELTQELGIRVISPIANLIPENKDIMEPSALINKELGFDPTIVFEIPGSLMTDRSKIVESGAKANWRSTFKNDDASEKVILSNEKETASVIRPAATSPKFAGLYRVKISAAKDTKLVGSYLMQVGSVGNNSIVISDNLEDLFKKVNNQ